MANEETVAQHTPGPWKVSRIDYSKKEDVSFEIIAGTGDLVAQTIMREIATQSEQIATDEANARLMAAAPDLLVCLRRMCGMYGAHSRRLAPLLAAEDDDAGTIWTFERANSLAIEAIAKAEFR